MFRNGIYRIRFFFFGDGSDCCCCSLRPFRNRIKGCLILLHFYWFFAIAFWATHKENSKRWWNIPAKECVTWSIRDTCLALLISILNFGWLLYTHFIYIYIFVVCEEFFTYKIRVEKKIFFLHFKCLEEDEKKRTTSAFLSFFFFRWRHHIFHSLVWCTLEWMKNARPRVAFVSMAQKLVPSKNLIYDKQQKFHHIS